MVPERALEHRALIALGSNLGDRLERLEASLRLLSEVPSLEVLRTSSWVETAPVGGPPQGPYLNGASVLATRLAPRELLVALLVIEARLGRTRETRFGPRTIDLDLLLYDDQVIDEPDLRIPHPRMLERGFVLGPAREVAGRWRHPETGRTIEEHWWAWAQTAGAGGGA